VFPSRNQEPEAGCRATGFASQLHNGCLSSPLAKGQPFQICLYMLDMSRHDKPGLAVMSEAVLSFDAIRQDFPTPGARSTIRVIDGISFEVASGKFVAVIGPSGCGKSTLLQMAAGLLMPTRGGVRHRGRAVNDVNREVGFVPQQAQLFPWKTLAENVELPLLCAASPPRNASIASPPRSRRSTSTASSIIFRASCRAACRSAGRSRAPSYTGRTLS
jgi:ABC-type multidrug transport system fused ATPase/permease subunit